MAKIVPKSQKEISAANTVANSTGPKPITTSNKRRELQRSVKGDNTKRFISLSIRS